MRTELSAVPFEDAAKAEESLERLEKRIAPSLMAPLASLLTHSPDPDGALNLLERYAHKASAAGLEDLASHPTALTYLVAIFGASGYLAETFLADPGLAVQFARDRNFTKLKSVEDLMQDFARFSTTHFDPWLSSQLARFKQRNHLRIALKDVLRLAALGETMLELSALADVILGHALAFCDRELEKRYGQPQHRDGQRRIARSRFSIVSLGELGGLELNYGLDIGLLFLYSHDGETSGGSEQDSILSNKEYFVRLAAAIIRTVSQSTPQGELFRVDLRLRPEGEQGDLAISLNSAREYYEHRARPWEFQMLTKARHSAGDAKLTREFLRSVEPYIYGSPADFEAIDVELRAREKTKARERRHHAIDVKALRGGIRDIEFLTQCLQRLRGGQDPWVRSGGTLFALRKLNDKGWLSDADYARLTSAYEFLRTIQHRIQLEAGKQACRLPAQPEALARLARRVGVEAAARQEAGAALQGELESALSRVQEICHRLLRPSAALAPAGPFSLEPAPPWGDNPCPCTLDSALGFLDAHAPELARVARETSLPAGSRKNVARLLAALLGSSEAFRLARLETECVRRALEATAGSEYLAELLIQRPASLADLDALAPAACPESPVGGLEIGAEKIPEVEPFPRVAASGLDIRERMALLRQDFRARALALGAADLHELRDIFEALRRWSALAARAIASALLIAAESAEEGSPSVPVSRRAPLAVLGFGRLGSREFDLACDADLVFVTASGISRKEIACCARRAAKMIEALSSYTRDGNLFAVDTRLRPRGQEGELVVTEDELLGVVGETASVWDLAQYLKAVPVAGNFDIGRRAVSRLASRLLERFSDLEPGDVLREAERQLDPGTATRPSNDPTAASSCVDFAALLLRLRHGLKLSPGSNVAEQIGALCSRGLVREEDARALAEGAVFLRSVDHAVRLVVGRPAGGLPEGTGQAEAVETVARRWGLIVAAGDPHPGSLAQRWRETEEQVRDVCRRLLRSG